MLRRGFISFLLLIAIAAVAAGGIAYYLHTHSEKSLPDEAVEVTSDSGSSFGTTTAVIIKSSKTPEAERPSSGFATVSVDAKLDVRPYADKIAFFSVRAEGWPEDDSFTSVFDGASLAFDRASATLFVVPPSPQISYPIFRLYPYDSSSPIEDQIKNALLKETSDRNEQEFRSSCLLKTWQINGITAYRLDIKPEAETAINQKYGDAVDSVFYCGATKFYIISGFLVQDFKVPIDATEPGLIIGSLRFE